MTTSDSTTALVLRWVAVYTRSLDPAVAARRQAELASDMWEQRAHARQVGAADPLVAKALVHRGVGHDCQRCADRCRHPGAPLGTRDR